MVNEFFNTVKGFFIFTVIAIILIIIIVAIKSISEKIDDKQRFRQKEEEEKKLEIRRKENEIIVERRRDMYWDNLSLVYGDKDRRTLTEVLEWVERFNRLPEIGDDDYTAQTSQNRSECRENIKRILGYPQWIIQGEDKSDSPIWLDLDIKYIKLLLQ